jgi:hypothetical protein
MSRKTGFSSAALLLPAFVCAGCAMAPPRVAGVAGTAPSADVPWTPPAGQVRQLPRRSPTRSIRTRCPGGSPA